MIRILSHLSLRQIFIAFSHRGAKGQPFDTDLHEAVSQFPVPDEEAKGKVFDVVQTGYKLGGKVIRYAKVVVGV